jgi:hypothetical protein
LDTWQSPALIVSAVWPLSGLGFLPVFAATAGPSTSTSAWPACPVLTGVQMAAARHPTLKEGPC